MNELGVSNNWGSSKIKVGPHNGILTAKPGLPSTPPQLADFFQHDKFELDFSSESMITKHTLLFPYTEQHLRLSEISPAKRKHRSKVFCKMIVDKNMVKALVGTCKIVYFQ